MPSTYEQMKRWRARNPKKWAAEKARRRARHQKWIDDFKQQHPCACGETDPICIDFHPLDPKEKEMTIHTTFCLTRIIAEIKKCVCICANCHSKGHAGRPRPEHAQFFPPIESPE